MLTDKIRDKVIKQNLIPRGGHVVVGFSGGPDSTCLFDILTSLSRELSYTVSAVHVNHGLRKNEADEDQWYVEKQCEDAGVHLLVKSYDVALIAERMGKSVEEAGRDVRYEAFAEEAGRAAAKRGANPDMVRIALAHNRGDLSETVLMRIIRGTGPDGLSGISALRDGEGGYGIIRPLIDSSRTEIEEYCSFRGLNPRIDSTNEKTDYLRNSVRLELLPTLREKYNPSVDDALARLSRAAAESRDYFDTVVGETIEKEGEFAGESGSAGPSSADFPLDTLKRSHPAIRHRLILGIFGKIGLTQDIGASHIAAADDIIEGGRTGKYIDLPKGYRFGISYEKTVFTSPIAESDDSERPDDEKRSFAIAIADIGKATGNITIFEGSGFPIEAEVKDYDGTLKSGAALVLDYEALSSEAAILQLRSKLDGDRICPPGIDGSKKLQDIFVDKKIPREKRSNIPVISTENEVLWIPGIRRTRLYEPNSATKRVIVLSQQ